VTRPAPVPSGGGQGAPVLVERDGPVCIVTLNRPASLNAVDDAVAAAVGQALDSAATDPDVRVVVLTGSGRAFCAGADLKAIADGRGPGLHPQWGFAGVVQHWVPKPLIAAVNGPALGGGMEIVLACDLAVADPSATFALPEVTRGLAATGGGVLRLHRQVPLKIALEVALTGETFSAQSVLRWGLVNRLSEPGSVVHAAVQLAHRVADNAPLAVQVSKRLVHRAQAHEDTWDPAFWRRCAEEGMRLSETADAQEGARAFLEGRVPRWSTS